MFKKLFSTAIVALGIVWAVPSLRAEFTATLKPYVDNVKARFVPSRLEAMANQLDARLQRGGGLPAVFEGWLNRDFSGSSEDVWGNLYYLDIGRRDYTVGSMGPDGVRGTEDDIIEPRRPLTGEGPGARRSR